MKKLLLLGALVSSIAMADVIEVRVGGDLTNRATFKDTDNQNWKINDDALKNGFEITGEYRTPIAENLEIGGGIAYRYNKLSSKNYPGLTMKGINSVPIFFTTRYNFKNASEITPYVKGNLGLAITSGKVESKNILADESLKFESGIYYGIGTGLQYKNFVADLSYNVNTMKTKYSFNMPGYKEEGKFNTNHGTLTLGVGYSFGF
ncbi:outer membrane beta-barrel protein [Leptotrichia buccalis]|jgi:hypothetical protein|uniref:Uncharacterized protein n=1 Tax=Leptotrichia buccalis (strain ATCC 14201 / DSM 1135 / JCM 12969 / NCTC 10249 / C-1013-b) TaxID=523794 RepID=C7N8I6_LEPBD|nr:outer membrane beta-barrel protein [Leptotrichia buccalis]ACV38467.1 hypothetical protein Lebu_0557 [Leptotrichia buccalis C-1013-b]